MTNKEPTNNDDSHNTKSINYNKYSVLFDKEKRSKKRSTKSESDINENKNKLLLTYDHETNNYQHYKNNIKKHKEKYFESSIIDNENNANAK